MECKASGPGSGRPVVPAEAIWQTCRLMTHEPKHVENPATAPVPAPAATAPRPEPAPPARAREIGGRDGPEPTRYGDWEKAGRCIDF